MGRANVGSRRRSMKIPNAHKVAVEEIRKDPSSHVPKASHLLTEKVLPIVTEGQDELKYGPGRRA